MGYNYDEQIRKQDEFLTTVFRNMTDIQMKQISKGVNKLVEKGILNKEDYEDIHSVIVWKSIKGFYNLETQPREELWKLLNEICK